MKQRPISSGASNYNFSRKMVQFLSLKLMGNQPKKPPQACPWDIKVTEHKTRSAIGVRDSLFRNQQHHISESPEINDPMLARNRRSRNMEIFGSLEI